MLKELWIKENVDNFPPRTHDLTKLYNETDLNLDSSWYDFLVIINEWNIEGWYPDYKLKIYNRATNEYVANNSKKIQELIILIKANF